MNIPQSHHAQVMKMKFTYCNGVCERTFHRCTCILHNSFSCSLAWRAAVHSDVNFPSVSFMEYVIFVRPDQFISQIVE